MPRRPGKHHYSVYVVELADAVWNEPSFRKSNPDYALGKPFVYVGMTGLDPDVRFDKHKAGIQSNRFVREHGVRLRPSCTRCSTRCPTMARATWRSSSRSACVKKVMASGKHDVRHAHRTLRVSRVSADRAAIVPLGGSADVPIGRGADMTQAQRLARMKLLAVGLLAAAAVLYAVASALEPRHIAWGFVAAFAEAAMIGAMADWFAVVALFRHPLGLPIPHTAIIPNNKARIGSNLANFICNNFLGTPQVLD